MIFILALIASFVVSVLLIPQVKRVAFKVGAIDQPKEARNRKIHKTTMARAGGLAIYASFVLVTFLAVHPKPTGYWGMIIAGTIVLVIGLVDDIHRLSPWVKLGGQVVAALVAAVGFGIGIDAVSNPFGNTINLQQLIGVHSVLGFAITGGTVAIILTVIWLIAMTNTMNFLDGLDGLSGGVAAIAAFVMFLISLTPRVDQPQTAMLSLVLMGACLGYLIFNFYPAKIFLGDSGAYFLGMTLGILAILSGAKLATAALVLGLPLLDAFWAVLRRLIRGRSPFTADRGHLHHLLLDNGLSQRQAVFVIYGICVVFGGIGVYAGTSQKLIAFVALCVVMVLLLSVLATLKVRRSRANLKT